MRDPYAPVPAAPSRQPGRPPRDIPPREAVPARAPEPPRAGTLLLQAAGAAARSAGAALRRRPAAALACAAALGAAGTIALNAASYQARRHPAPLFAAPRAETREARREEAPRREARPETREARQEPRPEPRPEVRSEPRPEARPGARPAAPERQADPPQAAAPLPPARPAARPVESARHAEVATGSVGSAAIPEPDAAVTAAQRALARLGHPDIRADGLMGPLTRQAIERFEREQKLPVTGEANPRTLRALQARAAAR